MKRRDFLKMLGVGAGVIGMGNIMAGTADGTSAKRSSAHKIWPVDYGAPLGASISTDGRTVRICCDDGYVHKHELATPWEWSTAQYAGIVK